ncbi:MAG: 50S ribosomal protein L29 [Chloroherpetonaceae bacterium]|nr:50S ribosomal protein L29 [Chloroherpetonaceae bacterium]MDW8437480.1 50S ribosomal protein L29 [Chloroherpetonaceae bacterium]
MKKYEIAALSPEEMKQRIRELKKAIADIKFNKAFEPPQNPMILRNMRKDIARMKTFLNQQKAKAAKQSQPETN